MSTSQAALEIAALLSLALIFFGLVQVNFLRDRNAAIEESLLLQAKEAAESSASAIDQAYLGGDGFSINFTLPARIGGYNYSVSIASGHVYVSLANFSLSTASKIIPAGISGSVSPGENSLANTGGVIYSA